MLNYKSNQLTLGTMPLSRLVKNYTSPFYVYDLKGIAAQTQRHVKAFQGKAELHYAIKANNNLNVLATVRKAGAGADVVSGGELRLALEAGFKPSEIIFSGVAKTKAEIELALKKKIKLINAEGPQEIERIAILAKKLKTVANIGIRFNPDVSAETHPYITTGFRENKFGMDENFLPELTQVLLKNKKHVNLVSISLHIGSQLREFAALSSAIQKTLKVWQQFEKQGFELKYFDIGGGVGIDYYDGNPVPLSLEQYAETAMSVLKPILSKAKILCEPGRILVGPFGALVARVEYVKITKHKSFVILDTGMHHLMRPTLYEAHHRILPFVQPTKSAPKKVYDVVGPVCESSDFLARDRKMTELKQDDFVAIGEAGAYGATMASLYNLHALPREVCVLGTKVLKDKPSKVKKSLF